MSIARAREYERVTACVCGGWVEEREKETHRERERERERERRERERESGYVQQKERIN